MAEGMSRRSRLYVAQQEGIENRSVGTMAYEMHYGPDENGREYQRRATSSIRTSSSAESLESPLSIAMLDVKGYDITRQVTTTSTKTVKVSAKAEQEGRPLNFGVVEEGLIYRSRFPMLEDHEFLGSLGLKTILTLVKGPYPPHFHNFMRVHGIRHHVIEMQGTKKVEIPADMMKSIMNIVLEKANHPLLIHCNHGIHRTGCAVAIKRLMSGWTVDSTLVEYSSFAGQKTRDCDMKYITGYRVSATDETIIETTRVSVRSRPVLTSPKMGRMLCITILALVFWLTVLWFWKI